MTETLSIPQISLAEYFDECVEKYPERKMIDFYFTQWTYLQTQQKVEQLASGLKELGVKKGDRVALMLPNCPHYVVGYFAIQYLGAIVVQVNPLYPAPEVTFILQNAEAKVLITLDMFRDTVRNARKPKSLKAVIYANLFGAANVDGKEEYRWDDVLKKGGGINQAAVVPKEDVAVLQYTGGTTGRPKGAMLTHYNLLANVWQSRKLVEEEIERFEKEGGSVLCVIPFFHVYGMTVGMNITINGGGTMILLPRFDKKEVLATIKEKRPDFFPGVPTMYTAINETENAESFGIDAIRVMNSGSAPLPLRVLEQFEAKTGGVILEGYGLSEASPITHSNPIYGKRKPGTVGKPVAGTECKIVDLKTGRNVLPPLEPGEVCIKGPQVMKGYWRNEEETKKVLRDGWLYTGDIGFVDEEGYLTILDRKKEMIIAGGFNVYPREVEEVLVKHSEIVEAAVIGVPDSYRGETVKAFYVTKNHQPLAETELDRHCRHYLAAYKVPKIYEHRRELPKTLVGKVLKRKLSR